MTKQEMLEQYEQWLFETSAYKMALSIINIDEMTVAPKAGRQYRQKRSAFLAGELFKKETDPKMLEIVIALQKEDIDEETKRALSLYQKSMENAICIPQDEYVAFYQLSDESYAAWVQAKTANDYTIFEPYLKKMIEGQKKMYAYRNRSIDLYDQMLDDYEPGMTKEKYDAFFQVIKDKLVPFIQKIQALPKQEYPFMNEHCPMEVQKKYTDQLLAYLRFDPSWGYQNETEHPFTSWTSENDCRTTTKYHEDQFLSAILSTIHEVGHATYEHQIADRFDGMILSEGVSSGMHESQSRLFENYLGRSRSFWKYHFPILQKTYPSLKDVDFDTFMKAVNQVECSLVRIEADELTYPLHILVRYEIEKGLFDGSITTDGLDQTWNAMYQKYLGVQSPTASQGILQDVHWSGGSFGYFPTYALGSAIAAQFMHTLEKEMDVDQVLQQDHFEVILDWLKEHVHQYGCRYDANQILKMTTGEEFNPNYYVDYLIEKYSKVYGLSHE